MRRALPSPPLNRPKNSCVCHTTQVDFGVVSVVALPGGGPVVGSWDGLQVRVHETFTHEAALGMRKNISGLSIHAPFKQSV